MDPLTTGLMLSAAILHASWHALVKSSGSDGLTLITGMGLVAAIMASCALPFVRIPASSVWFILAVSVILHSGYRLSLARAYVHGDLSQAYPLARGFVPLFATAMALLILGQKPSTGQLMGIGIISCGLILLAKEALIGLKRGLLLAGAGVGITVACYSVVDAHGVRLSGDWASYTVWLIVLDSGAFFLVLSLIRGRRLWLELRGLGARTLVSGLLGVVSFAVFLWALSRSPVGAVSALRETSVLFATFFGMSIYGEQCSVPRVMAVAAIVGGIAAIAIIS